MLAVDGVSGWEDGSVLIGCTTFVEGVIFPGETVDVGTGCHGTVVSLGADGKSFVVAPSDSCGALVGDDVFLAGDLTILESITENGWSVSGKTSLTTYSNEPVAAESSEALYRIGVQFQGVTRHTACLDA